MKLIFSICQGATQKFFDAKNISYGTLLRVCEESVRHKCSPYEAVSTIKGVVEVTSEVFIEIEKQAVPERPCRSVLFDFNLGLISVWDITDKPHLVVEVDIVPSRTDATYAMS